MYNAKDMYWIAQAVAIEKGPSAIIVDGKQYASYNLSRTQVEDLFEDNHYNLDRISWRNAIKNWKRYGAVVPKVALDPTYHGDWYILFDNIDKKNHVALRMFAEKEGCFYYPELAEGVKA